MALTLFTARLHPKLLDPDLLDVTRAGVDRRARQGLPAPGAPFAPSWAILGPALRGRVDDPASMWAWYAPAYVHEQAESLRRDPAPYRALLARPRVVVACVCPDEEHCHRTLLADFLAALGADYRGELPPPAGHQESLFR